MSRISVLLPVDTSTDPAELRRAHGSITEQTKPPEEVVLATNQSLEDPLAAELSELTGAHDDSRRVHVPSARGLGGVLQAGLQRCEAPFVARMDADDVADPKRFAEQLATLGETAVDVVGSQLGEFREDPDRIVRTRRVPTTHEEIETWMPWRCPVNHPTVMFDREAVLDVGGYREFPMMEDWDLWARCLAAGLRFRNLDAALVSAKTDRLADRRGGLAYARAEVRMARELRRLGVASLRDTARHLCLRVPIRLLPRGVRGRVYDAFAR